MARCRGLEEENARVKDENDALITENEKLKEKLRCRESLENRKYVLISCLVKFPVTIE